RVRVSGQRENYRKAGTRVRPLEVLRRQVDEGAAIADACVLAPDRHLEHLADGPDGPAESPGEIQAARDCLFGLRVMVGVIARRVRRQLPVGRLWQDRSAA